MIPSEKHLARPTGEYPPYKEYLPAQQLIQSKLPSLSQQNFSPVDFFAELDALSCSELSPDSHEDVAYEIVDRISDRIPHTIDGDDYLFFTTIKDKLDGNESAYLKHRKKAQLLMEKRALGFELSEKLNSQQNISFGAIMNTARSLIRAVATIRDNKSMARSLLSLGLESLSVQIRDCEDFQESPQIRRQVAQYIQFYIKEKIHESLALQLGSPDSGSWKVGKNFGGKPDEPFDADSISASQTDMAAVRVEKTTMPIGSRTPALPQAEPVAFPGRDETRTTLPYSSTDKAPAAIETKSGPRVLPKPPPLPAWLTPLPGRLPTIPGTVQRSTPPPAAIEPQRDSRVIKLLPPDEISPPPYATLFERKTGPQSARDGFPSEVAPQPEQIVSNAPHRFLGTITNTHRIDTPQRPQRSNFMTRAALAASLAIAGLGAYFSLKNSGNEVQQTASQTASADSNSHETSFTSPLVVAQTKGGLQIPPRPVKVATSPIKIPELLERPSDAEQNILYKGVSIPPRPTSVVDTTPINHKTVSALAGEGLSHMFVRHCVTNAQTELSNHGISMSKKDIYYKLLAKVGPEKLMALTYSAFVEGGNSTKGLDFKKTITGKTVLDKDPHKNIVQMGQSFNFVNGGEAEHTFIDGFVKSQIAKNTGNSSWMSRLLGK